MRKIAIRIFAGLIVLATLIAAGVPFISSGAAEAPEQNIFAVLKAAGHSRLVNGQPYALGGGFTVTFDARNGLESPIDLELVERTGPLVNDSNQRFTGVFAERAPRNNNGTQSADPEPEDANVLLTFNRPFPALNGWTNDNDPKPTNNGQEDGAIFIDEDGIVYVVPKSRHNVDNEMASVSINKTLTTIRFKSQDSWHFLLTGRIPETVPTATPTTGTSTPVPTNTPTLPTPTIPPGTQVYTLYLSVVQVAPPPPTPTATPTPANDCTNTYIRDRDYHLENGVKVYEVGQGTVVTIVATSLQPSPFNWWHNGGNPLAEHGDTITHFVRGSGTDRFEARLPEEGSTDVECHILIRHLPNDEPTPEIPSTATPVPQPTSTPVPQSTETPPPPPPPPAAAGQ
jgi:hypothetical protein